MVNVITCKGNDKARHPTDRFCCESLNSQGNETKISLIKPHDIQFDNMLVNTVWEILHDGLPRGFIKIIFDFILQCFTNGTVIKNLCLTEKYDFSPYNLWSFLYF